MFIGKVIPKDQAVINLSSEDIKNPEDLRWSLYVAKESYKNIQVDAHGQEVTEELQALLDEFGATVINASQTFGPK
ncbi:MAG: hypothetical protein Q8M03_07345 [Legionella sp.]|nr:hypothetical protein [Legionella sp.]